MVCNIKSDKAKSNLTDIFSCLIELCRGKQAHIKLGLKGLGALNVYKSKEIAFSGELNQVQNTDNDYDTQSFFDARNQAEDLNTVIDGASAILS
jgi:hypothetical protein